MIVTEHMQLGSSQLQIDCGLIRDSLQEVVGMLLSWADVTDSQRQSALSRVLEVETPVASFSPDGRLVEMNAPFRALGGEGGSLVLGAHWDQILSARPAGEGAEPFADWEETQARAQAGAAFRVSPKGRDGASAARTALFPVRDYHGRLQSLMLVFVPEIAGDWGPGCAPERTGNLHAAGGGAP